MLRVLTLATLFPNGVKPTLGVFVERQTRALAAQPGVEVRVVAPVGLPVWPLSLHPHFAPLRRLPRHEQWHGLKVDRPPYRVWPAIGAAGTARRMAAALLPVLRELRRDFPFDEHAQGRPEAVGEQGRQSQHAQHRAGLAESDGGMVNRAAH